MGKVLAIEDDVLLRETLVEILELAGHNVIQAANGVEGIMRFKEMTPDIIICDINMPYMDGFGVLEELHRLSNEDKIPPFIFLSAKIEKKNIRRGISLGAVDFVPKPYSAKELLDLIDLRIKE